MFCLKIKIMSNFRPLEVVGRGGDTQLQVSGNLNDLFERFVGYRVVIRHWSYQKKAMLLISLHCQWSDYAAR